MNKNNKLDRDIQNDNTIILFVLGALASIFFIITSLPAIIIAIILTLIFIKIKVNKLIFTILGLGAGFIVNIKIKFSENYLTSAINFIKSIFSDSQNIASNYKNYITNINLIWQLVIAIIIGGAVAYIFSLTQNENISNEEAQKEKMMNKALEKIKKVPHEEIMTTLGIDYDKLEEAKIYDNSKHLCIAGTTGAGKTVAISNIIESGMQKGIPILAVDGKGDLDKGSLLHYMQDLSKKYNRKLYVINITNPEQSDLYNPFKGAKITEAKDMLIGMNRWSEEHYKVNTERYLQQLIGVLKLANIELDLNTIIKYSPGQFKILIEELKDNGSLEIEDYTRISEIIENTAQIVNSAMARFATTAESEAGEIFHSSGIDIFTAMKEKANILIILDSLGKPELSRQVGRLAVLDAKKAVSKLFGDKGRKFFIFDEFNVYASDEAVDLLNKSRSANVTCIPAFQSLSDLDKAGGVALRNQVIENCNNYIIMRQNSPDSSQEWEKVIGQEETTNYTYSIQESTSLFSNKNKTTGAGSMHTTMESKYKATEIQNLQTGQGIFISKDQQIDKKIKMKYVSLDSDSPILEKRKIFKESIKLEKQEPLKKSESLELKENENNQIEEHENIDFKEIEDMLNS